MRKLLVGLLVLLVSGGAAPAANFDTLAAGDKGVYCHGYIYIDLYQRQQEGLIDATEMDRASNRAAAAVMRKAGHVNYGHYERRANQAVRAILAEKPAPEVFAARVETCRRYLRL